MIPVAFIWPRRDPMFIEKQNHGLHLTPAGVTSPMNQLFSINMQTLWVLEAINFVLHDHPPGTFNRLKAQHTLAPWQRLGKRWNNNPMATTWENRQNFWIAPQSFKSWMKITNNITALSLSWPVIARSAAQTKFWKIIICTPKQSHPKKHRARNNVLTVLKFMGLPHPAS